MGTDTTALSYWLNWRFLLCALFILASMVVSALIIWKYEGPKKAESDNGESSKEPKEPKGLLRKNEAWKTSLKVVHPGWLLAYRVMAFGVLLALFIINFVGKGGWIFFFYTQWTFTLVTIYFGFASLFSMYGCCRGCKKNETTRVTSDEERGTYVAPTINGNSRVEDSSKTLNSNDEYLDHEIANTCEYFFQIIYQICAGSVILTDCVFWFVIYPFMSSANYKLGLIDICFHSVNAVLLLGDVFLNRMRFPFFRIAYFILWTSIYVTFQWIIHASVSLRWPYPFLELSSPYAPVWYLAVGFLHLPCYGVFALIMKLKHCCFSRVFPNSFQCSV